ncbi:unnamed protein product [Sphagnum troendelagicum]|uniref:RING-type E3 ubiquitin transferase n=1 Tax=Sphagnum troendelagicum TaxID=128251 RepID=A0ABP0TKZ6_9BRYO
MTDLPCDTEGRCMVCKDVPPDCDVLLCNSCSSPWHMQCLHPPLESVPSGDWDCPDCCLSPLSSSFSLPPLASAAVDKPFQAPASEVVSRIRAIQADESLTEVEKAKRRQEIMSKGLNDTAGILTRATPNGCHTKNGDGGNWNSTLKFLDQSLDCIFCMQLADRPVTTPCGHNFCLKCFQKWVGQGKKTCGKCRAAIPAKMASHPRINAALVIAIRMAKTAKSNGGPPKVYQHRDNDSRPDKCFTTSRAVKTGKANACSGKIFVTIPPDHFGPIPAENDPLRNQGVLVGESWEDRLECRQWGAHMPHVAGIAGQSDYGSQSVALSGGYEDDEDHGEWFLYTGSGGRDLSGNKRTNKEQSFDQKFDKMNEALRISCKQGYPVRVVRSHKEKRSCYAPETGVRYDGVYRIEKCWRKKGIQGYQVCRYLFVRCDNEPAPWTSDEQGDRPRPLPEIEELKIATDIFDRKLPPSWDFKECGEWGWMREAPPSRKTGKGSSESVQKRKQLSMQQRLLKEFGCGVCRKVLQQPLSMPCGHNFCKPCLDGAFGQQSTRERTGVSGRPLRTQKVMKRCPTCNADISDYLITPQINRQMEEVIQTLQDTPVVDHSSDTNEEADEIGDDCKPGKLNSGDQEGDVKGCSKPTSNLQKEQNETQPQGKNKPIPEAGKATLKGYSNSSKEPATATDVDKSHVHKRSCVDSEAEDHAVSLKPNGCGRVAKKARGNVTKLPPRITRTRLCNNGDATSKKLQLNGSPAMVEVSSDSDFE